MNWLWRGYTGHSGERVKDDFDLDLCKFEAIKQKVIILSCTAKDEV